MQGRFSIIGGHMPELPPKVYAYDSICVPYESHKGLSFLSHMDAICIPSMSWNLSPIIMYPMWILHMSHTTPKGVKFLSYIDTICGPLSSVLGSVCVACGHAGRLRDRECM